MAMAKQEGKLSVLVVGAGPAGLINARTLIKDGFDVTIVCRVGVFYAQLGYLG